MKRDEVAKALVVTAEVVGHELSVMAAEAMARELAGVDPSALVHGLRRCQRELRGKLTLAAVLDRLPGGHPGAEEAWAMCPRDESASVVWTTEIANAFGAARPLLEQGDQVAARMAFREAYEREVAESREAGRVEWWASLGHDVAGRSEALATAVERGRLPASHAKMLLGDNLDGLAAVDRAERALAEARKRLAELEAG